MSVHGKGDVEAERDLAATTAKVEVLPTLMAFKKGKLVFKQGGIANPLGMDNLVASSGPTGSRRRQACWTRPDREQPPCSRR